jgi:hypothetical protein
MKNSYDTIKSKKDMKRITGFSLLIILISYLLLLSKYFLIEEIFGFYLIPIVLIVIVASLIYLLIRIFKSINNKIFIIKFLIVSCILQIAVICLIFWSATPRFYSRSQIISDIDYALKIAEDVHPNLYNSISKVDFYFKVDSIKRIMPEKVSDVYANKTCRKIFSLIKDAHTKVGYNYFFKRGSGFFMKTLPYKFEIRDDRVFVTKNYGYKKNIPIGAEIISINDKPISQCLHEVSQLISYEIKPYRNTLLQIPYFWGLWNNFEAYKICYKSFKSKEIKTIMTSGGLMSKLFFINDFESSNKYAYKIIPNNIGYIEFNACENLEKFKSFLDSTFKSIKINNVKSLIIDVRKNSGGNSSLGDELMQYISKTDFRTFDSGFIKISNELLIKGKLNWIDSSKRVIGALYNFIDTSKTKIRENSLRFSGKTYLLIGGNTFSSAVLFASTFQCYRAGNIIGKETGGLTGGYYGDLYKFELPNTKFDMTVSMKRFFNACGIENKCGVLPDYFVENSFEDELNGIDRVLEFTIDLIKNNK